MQLFSTGGQLCEARESQQLKIKYNVDLELFPTISYTDLYRLHGGGYHSLEKLYISKKVFNIV